MGCDVEVEKGVDLETILRPIGFATVNKWERRSASVKALWATMVSAYRVIGRVNTGYSNRVSSAVLVMLEDKKHLNLKLIQKFSFWDAAVGYVEIVHQPM